MHIKKSSSSNLLGGNSVTENEDRYYWQLRNFKADWDKMMKEAGNNYGIISNDIEWRPLKQK